MSLRDALEKMILDADGRANLARVLTQYAPTDDAALQLLAQAAAQEETATRLRKEIIDIR